MAAAGRISERSEQSKSLDGLCDKPSNSAHQGRTGERMKKAAIYARVISWYKRNSKAKSRAFFCRIFDIKIAGKIRGRYWDGYKI
jgi:hypothetical protein